MKDEHDTKENLTEEALAHERPLLHLHMDNIPDWIFFKDAKSRFTRINRAHAHLLGIADPKEAVGKTDFDFFPGEVAQRFYEEEQKVIRSGRPVVARVGQTPSRDGEMLWVSETKVPLHNEKGEVVGLVGISRAITELKRAEEELKEARNHFETLFNVVVDPVVIIDGKGKILEITNRVQEVIGYNREELVGKSFLKMNLLTAKSKAIAIKNLAKRIMGMKIAPYEVEVLTKDGKKISFEIKAARIDYRGKPADMVVFRDLTERKKMEKALQKQRYDLSERVKELNCLYSIYSLVGEPDVSLEGILQGTVDLLPPAWQYPEITCARIILEDQIFKTKNYKETIWKQSAGITVYGNQVGTLEVCYLEEKPKSYEGPFFKEEGSLINAIAERLGKVIERKKAEEELVRLSNAMKISADSIIISDLDAKIIDVNESTLKMYGTDDRRELIGKNSFDLIAPEDREKAFARTQEVLEKGYVKGREHHIITKEGGRILVEMSVALMKDADDKPVGFVGVSRDITRRKRAETALKSERRHLEALFKSVRQGIATADLNHKIIDVNRSFTEMFGYTLEEIKGKDIDQIIVPREKLSEAIRITQQYDEGKISTVETVRKRKDGSLIPVEITGASIIIDSEQVGVYGIYKDITERKKAEEELKSSEERLRILFEFAPDAIYLNDLKGTFIDGNKAAEELTGYKREELIGKNFLKLKLLPPEQIPRAVALLAKNALGKPTGPHEFILNRKDGKQVTVQISTYPVKIEGKSLALGIARNITERKRAGEALTRSENLLSSIIDQSPFSTWIANANGINIRQNAACRKLLGIDRDEQTVGKYNIFRDPIAKEQGYMKQIEDVFKKGKTARFTIDYDFSKVKQVDVPGATHKLLDATIFPIKDASGRVVNAVVQHEDITERKKTREELQHTFEKLRKALGATIQALALTVEVRDAYTAGHQRRVTNLARTIATEMQLSKRHIDGIRTAGAIHDLGKIGVPAEILNKPIPLADIEFALIKIHSVVGYNILKQIKFPWPVAKIVLQHHERMDGSGYPHGLSGENILLEARILAVADVVEAMCSHRPYRPALGIDKALEEISQNRDVLYDPDVVDACLKLFTEKKFRFK